MVTSPGHLPDSGPRFRGLNQPLRLPFTLGLRHSISTPPSHLQPTSESPNPVLGQAHTSRLWGRVSGTVFAKERGMAVHPVLPRTARTVERAPHGGRVS